MAQKCARGLKPKQFGNEPVLIWLVCVCDSGMTCLADAYQRACLALFFLFVFGKREEQVCELSVCVSVWWEGTNRQTVTCCLFVSSSVLAICLSPFFPLSCLPQSPVCLTVHLSDLSSSVPGSVFITAYLCCSRLK